MSNRRKVKTIRATWRRRPGRPPSLEGKPVQWGRREIRLNDARVPVIGTTVAIVCTCPPKVRDLGCPTRRHRELAAREAAKRAADATGLTDWKPQGLHVPLGIVGDEPARQDGAA